MKLSIRYKFILGLLVIFLVGYSSMSYLMVRLVIHNDRNIVKQELSAFQRDLNLYIKQYFGTEDTDLGYESFIKAAKGFSIGLSNKTNSRIMTYSADGLLLYDTANAGGVVLNYENTNNTAKESYDNDLKLAVQNKSSYIIVPVEKQHLVAFSYPVMRYGERIGIIRAILDYNIIFSSGKALLRLANICTLVAFGAVFIFVFLLTSKITVPVEKLNRISKKLAEGDFETTVDVNTGDEIGELALSFDLMKSKIRDQLEKIKSDRDNLKKLEGYRKAFFDHATHEMKTPLAVISGYCQIMLDQSFEDGRLMKKYIQKIKAESESMHAMVLQLLEASKEESGIKEEEFENVDLSGLLTVVCDDMRVRADKYEMSFELKIEQGVVVEGSSAELRRALINLLDNSIKYGDVKSVIKVSLSLEGFDALITIADRGRGIPEDKLDKVFQPFYQAGGLLEKGEDSFGLGLAIVKKVIDRHKGTIEITSQENLGTTISIKIPLKVYKAAIIV